MTSPRSLPTSPCELSEREVTSPSHLKVVGALDNYSLVFVIFINFFGQLKDRVGQVLFLVSCPKGQVEKYVNVEACGVVGRQSTLHKENRGFAAPTPGRHISTFRGYWILFSIRNAYINRFTNHFSINS